MIDPLIPAAPVPPARPSVSDALKHVAKSPAATLVALVTALGGLLTAWQTYQESQQTARASYDTLREASQQNTQQIEACRQGQLELRTWVEELASRTEQRQATTEKAVARKVTKASAPPLPAPVLLPAPKAPPVPVVVSAPALPTFDRLEAP